MLFRSDDSVLTEARFDGANLNSAYWDPRPGTLPNMASLASAQNLHGLRYRNTSQQLGELREALYKAGGPAGPAGQPGGPGASEPGGTTGTPDDVIDAEVVDDDKK